MRSLGSILFVCLVGSASAQSFELITFVDTVTQKVVRYDPGNQVFLGSFGNAYLYSAYSVSTVNNNTMVWDYGQSRIFNFNTSSGILQNEIPTFNGGGIMSELSVGGSMWTIGNNTSVIYRPDGTTVGSFVWAAAAGKYVTMAETSTHYYQFCASIYSMRRFRKSDLVQDLSWANPNLGAGSLNFDVTMISLNGINRMVLPDRSGNLVRLLDADGSGAIGITTPLTTITGIAKGHGNILYVAGTYAGNRTRIYRYNYQSGVFFSVLDVADTTYQIESMSSIVAPEPASMSVLGIGILAAMKRRAKKCS